MTSYIGLAATAAALFVFILLVGTVLVPYLQVITSAIEAIGR